MNDLEELKRKRLKELQGSQEQDFEQEQQFIEQLTQLENTIKPYMSKEAVERFGTVRIAYPQKAVQSLVMIAQLIERDMNLRITDNMYKNILRKLTPKKHNFNIKRR